MGGAVQYRTTVSTILIMLTLHQSTACAHSAMNRQPKGALINEDIFQPIIQPYLNVALRATGTTGLWQDLCCCTEWAFDISCLYL